MVEMERKSGILVLRREKKVARLFIKLGKVIAARVDGDALKGPDAVYHLLTWPDGRFDFTAMDVDMEDEMRGMSTQFLLMEGARLIDEATRARRRSSARGSDSEPRHGEASQTSDARLSVVVGDEVRAIALEGDRHVQDVEAARTRVAVCMRAGAPPHGTPSRDRGPVASRNQPRRRPADLRSRPEPATASTHAGRPAGATRCATRGGAGAIAAKAEGTTPQRERRGGVRFLEVPLRDDAAVEVGGQNRSSGLRGSAGWAASRRWPVGKEALHPRLEVGPFETALLLLLLRRRELRHDAPAPRDHDHLARSTRSRIALT